MTAAQPAATNVSDWPMWRGPNGDGLCNDADVPLNWSTTTNIAWKTAIPGVGYSSPIVLGDCVFVTSAEVETKERRLFCVDRKSGELRWKRTVVTADIERMHPDNSPASGTPATDGERVFVAFQANDAILVAAYDFEGELVWEKSPGSFKSRHGFHTCPVLFEDSILISGMQDSSDAFLVRMDRASGEVRWKAEIDSPIRSFSVPLVIEAAERNQIVLSGANKTYAFDASSGKGLWQVKGPAEKTVSSLSFDGKHVFVSGGRESRLFAIRPNGMGDVTESHISWTARRGIPYISSPVLLDKHLHVISDAGIYTRIDVEKGETVTQSRLTSKTSSSPIVVADRVYITSEAGETTVLSSAGDILARNKLGESVYATLAVAGDNIFIRGSEHLFCISNQRE